MKKIQEQIKNIKTFFYSMVSSNYNNQKFQSTLWDKIFCSKKEQYERYLDRTSFLSRSDVMFLDRLRNGVQFGNIEFGKCFRNIIFVHIIGVGLVWLFFYCISGGGNLFGGN